MTEGKYFISHYKWELDKGISTAKDLMSAIDVQYDKKEASEIDSEVQVACG